jgi:hypothetical protein
MIAHRNSGCRLIDTLIAGASVHCINQSYYNHMELHLLSSHAGSAPQVCYKGFVVNVTKHAFRYQTEGFILKSSRRPSVSNSRFDDSRLRNETNRMQKRNTNAKSDEPVDSSV